MLIFEEMFDHLYIVEYSQEVKHWSQDIEHDIPALSKIVGALSYDEEVVEENNNKKREDSAASYFDWEIEKLFEVYSVGVD